MTIIDEVGVGREERKKKGGVVSAQYCEGKSGNAWLKTSKGVRGTIIQTLTEGGKRGPKRPLSRFTDSSPGISN